MQYRTLIFCLAVTYVNSIPPATGMAKDGLKPPLQDFPLPQPSPATKKELEAPPVPQKELELPPVAQEELLIPRVPQERVGGGSAPDDLIDSQDVKPEEAPVSDLEADASAWGWGGYSRPSWGGWGGSYRPYYGGWGRSYGWGGGWGRGWGSGWGGGWRRRYYGW